MASLTATEITLVVTAVIIAIVVIAMLLYLMRRLRDRKAKILGELADRPQLIQDRAFNRIAMARRESEILARQGSDTARARGLIAQAQGAFDVRNYDGAYQYAQQAHETLVHARSDGARLPSGAGPSTPLHTSAAPAAAAASPPVPAPAPTIPKNRAESQFQLRLLDQELDAAKKDRASHPTVREATQFRADAGAAFDRGDFTEAFRLALRGRRAIGATVESLPVTPGAPAGIDEPNGGAGAPDPTRAAEIAASAGRCPHCGYPALPGDAFCRGCGEPRVPTACPKCGAARQPNDTFCGRCGTPFS